jgi:hypothetical protein
MSPSKRGGKREGAGRKPLGPANLTPTTVWLSDDDLAYLRALRPDGNVSAAVRDVVARDREAHEREQG